MILLSGASALTGVVEASLLGLVAQIALALSADKRAPEVSLGPLNLQVEVGTLLLTAAALGGARLLLQLLAAWLPARIAADVQTRLRREIFAAYVQAEWPAQSAQREGHLQDLLVTHTRQAAHAALALTGGLGALVTLVALVAGAFVVSILTAALLLALAGGLFLLLRPLAILQRRLAHRVSETGLDLAASVTEASRIAEEHHVFGTGDAQARIVSAYITAHRDPVMRALLIGRVAPAAYQSVAILLIIAGLAVLAALQTAELATLGTLVLILIRSLSYGQQVQGCYTQLNETLPFVNRVQEEVNQFSRRAVPPGVKPLSRIEEIVLEGVGFAYYPGHRVIDDVNVRLQQGHAVAVVGPSGGGKSTLAQLLLRLRQPTEGRLLVNGTMSDEIRWKDWQGLVAYVPQDPKLIRGTVAENIRFFRDIPEEGVESAARAAQIHEEIMSDLGGYNVVVDHRGDSVSGGQRQRICLARAIAGGPQLLVLDEPTSALDVRSEHLIKETLQELRPRMTVVVVAHRAALVEFCDDVWEVVSGTVKVLSGSVLSSETFESKLSPNLILQ